MSHYTKLKTKITDKAALIKALADMGFGESALKIFDKPVQLEGYQGDKRQDTAEIIIPRKQVGGAANDIGFKLNEDGTWGAIISDYDRRNNCADHKSKHAEGCKGYSAKWLKKLTQRYSYHKVKEELESQGFFIDQESEEDGQIYIECSSGFGG